MNGIVAQIAALAAHAKSRERDRRFGGDEIYWSEHSTFQYVRAVKFKIGGHGQLHTVDHEVANSPAAWMEYLPIDAEVNLVSLGVVGSQPAHVASAFVGGTREGISVVDNYGATLWIPEWEVVGRYPERKIWSVSYTALTGPRLQVAHRTTGEGKISLQRALEQVIEFATDARLSEWSETFKRALRNLRSADPVAPYHPDILPRKAYSLAAQQLLAASVAAFVFGGMGSWNDVGLQSNDERVRYESVTKALYNAVMGGIVTSVNGGIEVNAG